MGKRRFDAGIPYTVGNGEVITFGQRVTSGASELQPYLYFEGLEVAELTVPRSYIPRQRLPCPLGMEYLQVSEYAGIPTS